MGARVLQEPGQPRIIAGITAVALLLAGTRWASYLGAPPVFLTDILLAAAVLHYTIGALRSPNTSGAQTGRAPAVVCALVLWATVRLIVGQDFSPTALRDFAPYLYAAVGVLGWLSARRVGSGARKRTAVVIVVALAVHAVWFALVTIAPSIPAAMPTLSDVQQLHIFSPRHDVDSALTGILAAVLLITIARADRFRVVCLMGFFACWALVLASHSRAGFIGAAFTTAAGAFVVLAGSSVGRASKFAVVAALSLAGVVGAFVLPDSTMGDRLLATVDRSEAESSAVGEGAAGTANARQNAWGAVLDWMSSGASSEVAGVGFGPDFLVQSGAGRLLVNEREGGVDVPRSPHNIWVGTYARLGLIGVVIFALAIVTHGVQGWRYRRVIAGDMLATVTFLIPIGLIVPATLGVVLESPFGAVPYWWAVGVFRATVQTKAESSVAGVDPRVRPRSNWTAASQ